MQPVRQRPGANEFVPPLGSRALSRSQLLVRAASDGALGLENVGRCRLAVNGEAMERGEVRAGDVIEIGSQLVLLCVERPASLPKIAWAMLPPFGGADVHGYVGESPAAWRLRRELAFAAPRPGHVLLLGATGTGKELVARALHERSEREGPFVARNAATLPDSLVDAELFGNLKGYPNPGMAERKGLVGAAHGGTLFLDEFGDVGLEAQAHLLRVLDAGEYQRLGEATTRRSNFRLVAATNRPESVLRPDVLARFDFRLKLPDIGERVEDLPFIVRHLLGAMTEEEPELRERLFGDGSFPKLSASFMSRLALHDFSANVRELRSLLWRAVSSPGASVEWPIEPARWGGERAPERKGSVRADELRRVLEANDGSISKSWRVLGLSSRYAMARLLRKHGVRIAKRTERK